MELITFFLALPAFFLAFLTIFWHFRLFSRTSHLLFSNLTPFLHTSIHFSCCSKLFFLRPHFLTLLSFLIACPTFSSTSHVFSHTTILCARTPTFFLALPTFCLPLPTFASHFPRFSRTTYLFSSTSIHFF